MKDINLLFFRLLVLFAFSIAAINASAATFTVNSTLDTSDAAAGNGTCADGAGNCTLRAAIEEANATAGADAINFGTPLFGSAQTISLFNDLPAVTEAVTITGTSSAFVLVDGRDNYRPFRIAANVTATVANLSAIHGYAGESAGGCILNSGTLFLTNAVVRNCQVAAGSGGGITNAGTMTITNSQIYDNSAINAFGGGGIDNEATLVVSNSQIYNNSVSGPFEGSGNGGGIFNFGGTLTLTDSTVRDNQASGNGGGVFNGINFDTNVAATANITRSTIGSSTDGGSNRADNSGGGVYNEDSTVNFTNSTITNNFAINFGGGYYGFTDAGASNFTATQTTVANNLAGTSGGGIAVSSAIGVSNGSINNTIVGDNMAGSAPDIFSNLAAGIGGTITSGGYNLIENTTGSNIVLAATDQQGDPRLLPLANNGGATETHALQNNLDGVSPAIDKGNSVVSNQATDQRGFTRPVDNPTIAPALGGNNADIGAFELQSFAPTAALVLVGGRVTNSSGAGIAKILILLTDSSGQIRTATTDVNGYYRFETVEAGSTYIITAMGKRYTFAQPSQVLNVNDATMEVNFVGTEQKRLKAF